MRRRSHKPVLVSVSSKRPTDSWSERNGIKYEFTAIRPDAEYKALHLTQEEVDLAVPGMVDAMSARAREDLAVRLLRPLSHAKLARVLALHLRTRVRLPKPSK